MLTVRPFYPFFLPFQNKQIYNYNNNFSKNNNSILKDSIKDNLSTSTEISSSDISEINPNSNTNIKNIARQNPNFNKINAKNKIWPE